MQTKQIALSAYYTNEQPLAELMDRMLANKVLEYIQYMDVEIVWNYGDTESPDLTIGVSPRDDLLNLTDSHPIGLFTFKDLLDEWLRHIADELDDGDGHATKRMEQLERAKLHIDRIISRIQGALSKAEREDADRAEVNRLLEEQYPHLSYARIWAEREAAEEEIRRQLTARAESSDAQAQDGE